SVIAADVVNSSSAHVFVNDPVSRAVLILSETNAERLPVLDNPESRRLLGTVSKRRLLSAYTEANLARLTAKRAEA
ncbi:MAG TPA: CBS domain-containing protein, partial [Planctomycetota bacterium]|nr:CBS domain-containing protein [Planctomycetota bacterium]